MAIDPGRRNEQITIERKNLIDNDRGGRRRPDGEPEYLPVAEGLWAEIIALRGGEALQNLVTRSRQLFKVTVPWMEGITTEMRIRWGDVAMNIRTANRSTDRADLVITAEGEKAA